MNSITSSQPAVPPRKWLQKNSNAQSPAIKPPMPSPGALSSTHNAISPIKIISADIHHPFRKWMVWSVIVGSKTVVLAKSMFNSSAMPCRAEAWPWASSSSTARWPLTVKKRPFLVSMINSQGGSGFKTSSLLAAVSSSFPSSPRFEYTKWSESTIASARSGLRPFDSARSLASRER